VAGMRGSGLSSLGFRGLSLRNWSVGSDRCRLRPARTQFNADALGHGVNVKGGIPVQLCHDPNEGSPSRNCPMRTAFRTAVSTGKIFWGEVF
jgi:hypothetical protein